MQVLKTKILPIFFIAVQCLVLYSLWPQIKYSLQQKIYPSPKKINTSPEKKIDPSLILTAVFSIKKKQKLKSILALYKLKNKRIFLVKNFINFCNINKNYKQLKKLLRKLISNSYKKA